MPVLRAVWLLQGYVVGTYLYFAIVFSLPICMGLAAVAMDLPVSLPLLLFLPLLLLLPVTLCYFCLVSCPALPLPLPSPAPAPALPCPALPCPALPCPIINCLL